MSTHSRGLHTNCRVLWRWRGITEKPVRQVSVLSGDRTVHSIPSPPPRPQPERFNPLVGTGFLQRVPGFVSIFSALRREYLFLCSARTEIGFLAPRACAYAHARVRTCTTPKTSAKQVINNDTCACVRLAGMRTITRVCVQKSVACAVFTLVLVFKMYDDFAVSRMRISARACARMSGQLSKYVFGV